LTGSDLKLQTQIQCLTVDAACRALKQNVNVKLI